MSREAPTVTGSIRGVASAASSSTTATAARFVDVPGSSVPGEITDCAGIAVTTLARADGEGHRLEAHHAEDNRREEVFERHNLTVVRVTVSDHARSVDTGARIRAAQRSGMRRDRRYDSWSLAKCSGHRVVDTTEPYRSTVGLTA